jgi:hypothetical protein
MYGRVDMKIQVFFTSPVLGDERADSRLYRFISELKASGANRIRGWVDPRIGLNHMDKLHFLTLPRLELRTPRR